MYQTIYFKILAGFFMLELIISMPTFVEMYKGWVIDATLNNYSFSYINKESHIEVIGFIFLNALFAILWYVTYLRYVIFPVGVVIGTYYVFDFVKMFFLSF